MGNKLTLEYVRAAFESEKATLESTEILSSKQKLLVRCPNNHLCRTTWNNFQQYGLKCPECSGRFIVTIDRISDELEKIDWVLHSTEYKGPHKKLKMKCPDPNHPILDLSWSDFYHEGVRCKYCSKIDPVAERSEEEQRSILITKRMRSDLCEYLDKPYPFVTTTFCGKLALEIVKVLGPRPAGMTIDHVISPAWFDHNKESQVKLCWSVGNCQWLLAGDNSRKSLLLTKEQMLELTTYQICVANLADWRSVNHENMMAELGLWMSRQKALSVLNTLESDRLSA